MDDVHQHGLRTAWLARRVVRALGLSESMAEEVAQGARSHDIGKQFLASGVLHKPGRLDAHERHHVETHAILGARALMSRNPLQREVLDTTVIVALLHHEWWNGQGYPFRLAGRAIPIAARVTAVADVFDALVHDRCYKRAWQREEAMGYLLTQRGQQFDPLCAEAMHVVASGLSEDWPGQAILDEEAQAVEQEPMSRAWLTRGYGAAGGHPGQHSASIAGAPAR